MWPRLLAEYNRAIIAAAHTFKPDLFFVFKGDSVLIHTVAAVRAGGALAINFYPDTSFDGCAARAIAAYDWVFTTKSTHIEFLKTRYDYTNATFVTHAFDPEVHKVWEMSERDRHRYNCDVAFIGNISKKKEQTLCHVIGALPARNIKIWGASGWRQASHPVRDVYQGSPVWGQEYAKAINGAKITLGLLYEGAFEAPAGDVITARTFEVPAAGGFLLHEQTEEAEKYFEGGHECVFFSDPADLVAKIRYFLDRPQEREAIAKAGRERCITSGYSVDDRVHTVVSKYYELRSALPNDES